MPLEGMPPHFHRSYKHFCENDYFENFASDPFRVAQVLDDIGDIARFHTSLIQNAIDSHAPVKSEIVIKIRAVYEFKTLKITICW